MRHNRDALSSALRRPGLRVSWPLGAEAAGWGGYRAETWQILALRRLGARISDFQPAGLKDSDSQPCGLTFFSRKFGRLQSSGQWSLRRCGGKRYLITDQFKAVSC